MEKRSAEDSTEIREVIKNPTGEEFERNYSTYLSRAGNPETPADELRQMAHWWDILLNMTLARNPSTPHDVLVKFAERSYVPHDVALNPVATNEVLLILAGDSDFTVRKLVARRLGTSLPSQSRTERARYYGDAGTLRLSANELTFKRWGRRVVSTEMEDISDTKASTSKLTITWRRARYGGSHSFELMNPKDWQHAIRVNQTRLIKAAPTYAGNHGGEEMTSRQSNHLWYGDHSDLNWRDRGLGQTLGFDNADDYVSNFLEHDPD